MNGSGHTDPERRLARKADEQFGLLRHRYLREQGLTQDAIDGRVARHRLRRIQDEVYAFGHTALRDEGWWLAALWACDGAVLSHVTAGAFHGWEVPVTDDEPVHVSTLRSNKSRAGLTVHRVRHLDEVDVFETGLFRVTHIPRTLVDLADVLDWDRFRALADSQRSLRVDKIREAQARTPRRPGAPLVTRLIDADDAHTKSEFERRFLRFLAAHELPRPDGLNVPVAGHTADCHYARERLVVELDGRAFHRRRAQMRADRQRDYDYQLAGQFVLRLVWDELHPAEASQTAARLRRALASRAMLAP